MSKRIVWDAIGEKKYKTGVKNGVLYILNTETNTYDRGYAWNGLISVNETPSGGEPTSLYADDIKYLTMLSAEEFAATIEAYMYPKEFEQCDGTAEVAPGVTIDQQDRATFALAYTVTLGNDVASTKYGKEVHIVYGLLASPSERSFSSINDSPEAATFSWEASSTPVNVTGYKPTSLLKLDSTGVDKEKWAALEDVLYGSDTADASLPFPDEIIEMTKIVVPGGGDITE